MKKIRIISLALIIAMVISILTACSSPGGGSSMFSASSAGTGVWNQFVFEYKDSIYFEPNTYDSGIWKMNADGSGAQKIIDTDEMFVWNANDSRIYFGTGGHLEYYTLQGTSAEYANKIGTLDDSFMLYFRQFYNDHIYFACHDVDDKSIKRVDMNFDGLETVCSTDSFVSSFWIDNDIMYMASQNGGISSYNLKTGEKKELFTFRDWGRLYVNDSKMYFTDDNFSLCSIPVDGSSQTPTKLLPPLSCLSYNVAGDWIYYFNANDAYEGENYSLYKIQTNGSNNTKVLDGSEINYRAMCSLGAGSPVDITENWIYYSNANRDFCRCDKNGKNIQILWSNS